ncbi:calcium-binding protein, partial [Parasynechococcus sp.]|uniref:calcium-binding protein n=1 Tax=Parasynechococcus sp. TaxID=3101203 RepID=UPI003703A4B2
PTPEPDTDTGFIIVTPTPSASDDNETSETNSQEAVESQTITNTSSTETGSAALVENSGNNDNLVTATLPPGVTITSEGSAVAQSTNQAQESLGQAISERETSAAGEEGLIQQVESFINSLPNTTNLDVRTITPTSVSTAPGQPIVITGSSTAAQGDSESNTQTEAFVIDLTEMPSAAPTQLQLHSIHFAVIFGPAVITGGTGSNVLIADNAPQRIVLGEDNDTLDGGGGNDTIGSAAGDDLLIGGNGRDLITGGADNDTLDGGTQADTLVGGSGNDVLSGGRGRDTLRGSSGDDILKGQDFHDRLKGGKGDDTLFGGKGRDVLIGGKGADSFRLSEGKDTIRDFSIADGDQLLISNAIELTIEQVGNNLLLSDTDKDISTTLKGVALDDLLAHQPELLA